MFTSQASFPSLSLRCLSTAFRLAGAFTTALVILLAPGCGGSTTSVPPPSISTQPADQVSLDGTTATFTVVASGDGLSYQWSRNGAAVAGATSAAYTTPTLAYATDQNARFKVSVSNSTGTAVSNEAKLTVTPKPTVLSGPANQTVLEGVPATFAVTAAGTGPFTYQWKRGGIDLPGASAATYSTAATIYAVDHGAAFSVAVTNGAGQVTLSSTASLSVTPRPTELSGPTSQTVVDGGAAAFSVSPSGTGPFTYQWKRNGANLPTATAAVLTLDPVVYAADHLAQFSVVVTNPAGQSTSSATAVLTVTPKPTVLSGPADRTAVDGSTATFSVAASGTLPLSYQWQRGGINLAGATSANYTTPAVVYAVDNQAQYAVVVTNGAGQSSVSAPARLTVTPRTTALSGLADQTVLDGDTATFTVTATGSGPFAYQWYRDGGTLIGAEGPRLVIPVVAYAQDHLARFTVQVFNASGQMTQAGPVVLRVTPRPTSLNGPADRTVLDGTTATFTVAASGTAPFTYQWRRGGSNLPGATSASYTTAAVVYASDHHAQYSVVVTNGAGQSVTSSTATLNVTPIPLSFITQPTGGSWVVGTTATLTCALSGSGPITYQWRKGTGDLVGRTSQSLVLSGLAAGDAGTYSVVATGPAGSLTSDDAVLVVTSDLSLTTPPAAQTVTAPDGATFSVVAGGTGPFTYQWKKNTIDIPGANAASYTTGSTDLKMVPDSYSVVVADDLTSMESTGVSFTVVAPHPFYLPGGQPVPVPSRPLSVWPSLHSNPVQFPNGSFMFGYDESLKNPAWTAYADFKVSSTFANSSGDYQTDLRMDAPQVSKASMGTHGGAGFFLSNGQGFDRGHMVMRSDVSYRYGPQAGDDATYMPNLVAQVSYFNQRLWNDLEEAVGGKFSGGSFDNGLTAIFGRVWVYTGPVFTGTTDYWVPSTEVYTKSPGSLPAGTLALAIPTACYKIMIAEPAAGGTLPRVIAWMSSNRAYATAESADIWKYTTSVQRIEELTGMDFFPSLPHDAALTALKATVDVRGWGAKFEKATGPNVHILKPGWDLIPNTTNPVLKGDTVRMGDPVTFEGTAMPNQAGGSVDLATGCSWTFGDATGTTTGLTTAHTYTTAGSFIATFSATDSLGHSNSITRVITVVDPSNTAPVVTPSTLPNVSVRVGNPVPAVTFTVSDDATASGSLVVTALSSDQTLVQDANLVATNTGGSVSLAITPEAGQIGSATITVTVADEVGATTTKTFTFSVVSNAPPVFSPSTIADASTTTGVAKNVTFSVSDDATASGSIVVTATSGNITLLPDANITVANVAGAITLTLTPTAGNTGTTLITVTATDGEAAATVKTFTLAVNPPAAVPQLIISQYYEGISNNKWIEITNVGATTYNATDTPMYVWLWSNPYNATGGSYSSYTITGTIAAGASLVIKNTAAILPGAGNVSGTVVTSGITSFNGDDVIYLSPDASAAGGATAYSHRTDVIGANDSATWTGAVGTSAGSGFANIKGLDRSFVRAFSVVAPNPVFTLAEWVQVDSAQITAGAPSLVDSAAVGTTNRLGYHSFSGGNP